MPLDTAGNEVLPPRADEDGGDGGFYCSRCGEVDCEWLGICPHTPDLWRALTNNPKKK